jgi:hypothetical protein
VSTGQNKVRKIQEIAVQLELPAKVTNGEPVAGRLRVTNLSDGDRLLTTPFYNATLNLIAFDHLWNLIAQDSLGKIHRGREVVAFAPGESKTFDLTDLTYVTGTSAMTLRLQKGTNYVLAVYHPGTDRLPELSSYPDAAASNVVKVEVH